MTTMILKQHIKQMFLVSLSASHAYWLVMIFYLVCHAVFGWMAVSFVLPSLMINIPVFVLRQLIETLLIFIVLHFFVRAYLKLYFIHARLTIKCFAQTAAYLAIVAIANSLLQYGIMKLAIFSQFDIQNIQFMTGDKTAAHHANLQQSMLWIVMIIEQYLFLLICTAFYYFWHQWLQHQQLQQQLKQAQLDQLTHQLNPHFLFNAFNTIRALIYEDKDKAAEAVTQLSEIFRVQLQTNLRQKVTLNEDWNLAQKYLAIEQMRLEERLQIKIEIDESCLVQKLPTLTLLTLVENAVKHGIAPNQDVGYIVISATHNESGYWQLKIINSVGGRKAKESNGTGLSNIKQRLQLMFSDRAAITWQLSDNQFCVIMQLPWRKQ